MTSERRLLLTQARQPPLLHQQQPGPVELLQVGNLKRLYQKSSEPPDAECDKIWRHKTHLIPSGANVSVNPPTAAPTNGAAAPPADAFGYFLWTLVYVPETTLCALILMLALA